MARDIDFHGWNGVYWRNHISTFSICNAFARYVIHYALRMLAFNKVGIKGINVCYVSSNGGIKNGVDVIQFWFDVSGETAARC